MASVVKNPPAYAVDATDTDSIPGWEWSPWGRNGCQLRHSCLDNPMDRWLWRAPVHWIPKNPTQFSNWTQHSSVLLKVIITHPTFQPCYSALNKKKENHWIHSFKQITGVKLFHSLVFITCSLCTITLVLMYWIRQAMTLLSLSLGFQDEAKQNVKKETLWI